MQGQQLVRAKSVGRALVGLHYRLQQLTYLEYVLGLVGRAVALLLALVVEW